MQAYSAYHEVDGLEVGAGHAALGLLHSRVAVPHGQQHFEVDEGSADAVWLMLLSNGDVIQGPVQHTAAPSAVTTHHMHDCCVNHQRQQGLLLGVTQPKVAQGQLPSCLRLLLDARSIHQGSGVHLRCRTVALRLHVAQALTL